MMLYSRLAAALLCGAVLLSVAACSDPASVGANLGPDSLRGGDPQTIEVPVSFADTTAAPSLTGIADETRPWRFLTGTVNDNLAGEITAEGYVDFLGTNPRPDTIAEAPAESLRVTLRLDREYVHGDTAQALTVELYDLSQDVDMAQAPADTSFPAEATPILTNTFSPTDTTVSFSLDQSWIAENETALQDDDAFEDNGLYGFKLVTTSGGAVVGFDHDSARLELSTSADTVEFFPDQSFTHVQRAPSTAASLPDDRRLLVDGLGMGLSFDWANSARLDSLLDENVLVNRAEITVPVDTAFRAPGPNFVRPLPSGYRLLATPRPDGPTCAQVGLFSTDRTGTTCVLPSNPAWVPAAARANSTTAFNLFDRWFLDGRPLASYRAEIASRPSANTSAQQTVRRGLPSTTPVVVRIPTASAPSDIDLLPRATLTVTDL